MKIRSLLVATLLLSTLSAPVVVGAANKDYSENQPLRQTMNTTSTIPRSATLHQQKAIRESGTWGTVKWTFDGSTYTLEGGIAGLKDQAPWKDNKSYNVTFNSHVTLPSNCASLFANSVMIMNSENMDTSHVTDMSYMFLNSGCSNLDLPHFNTSHVTNMEGMFENSSECRLDLSSFDTSNVTNMSKMFQNAFARHISLNFNTSKVTNMSKMFAGCYSESIDVPNFNASHVTNMTNMFSDLHNVRSLELSGWGINKPNIQYMFANSYLDYLDVSGWDTSKISDDMMYRTFYKCTLKKVALGTKSIFCPNTELPDIPLNNGEYTGAWKGSSHHNHYKVYKNTYTFLKCYQGKYPDKYVWQEAHE